MPNQNNFRSDVTNTTDITYLASRIVRVPTDEILLEQVAGSFGFDNQDNVELHFYTIPDNQLELSTIVTLNDNILKFHIVSYQDGTNKTYLRIDLTKLFLDKNLILIPGDYRMVINLFSDEVGNYTNRKLLVTGINDDRTEVLLQMTPAIDNATQTENQIELREFVEKSFIQADAVGVAEKIFKSGVQLNDPTEGVTSVNIIQNINVPLEEQTFDNTIARVERLGLRSIFEQQLNDFVESLYVKLREKIVVDGDERVQEAEFQNFIQLMVAEQIGNLRQTVDARIKIR